MCCYQIAVIMLLCTGLKGKCFSLFNRTAKWVWLLAPNNCESSSTLNCFKRVAVNGKEKWRSKVILTFTQNLPLAVKGYGALLKAWKVAFYSEIWLKIRAFFSPTVRLSCQYGPESLMTAYSTLLRFLQTYILKQQDI